MIKKIDILRGYIANGEWRKAISLASKFPRLGEAREAILQAQMAYTNPAFCLQIKKDPNLLIEQGFE